MTVAADLSTHYRRIRFSDLAQNATDAMSRGDTMTALRALGDLSALYADLAADLAIDAVREGNTQKAVADALGVPSRTLSGLRREAGLA